MRLGPRGAATVALAALSGLAVASYVRVFTGSGWLPRALLAAWLPIALVAGLRRLGLPRWAAGGATVVLGAVAVVALLAPDGGAPGSWSLLAGDVAREIASAAAALDTTYTPVAPAPGLLGLLLCAAWVGGVVGAVFLGEQSLPLAAVPSLVVYIFAAAVGAGPRRVAAALPFLVALLTLLYAEAWARTSGRPARPPGLHAAVPSAAAALAVALVAPVLAADYLAGGPRVGSGPASTTVISPIVQILPRLNDATPRVMFTVEAERPAYWRLTALDRFDGNAWSATGEYRNVRGKVGIDDPPGVRTVPLRQTYTIESLGGIWVPAAYAPARVSGMSVSIDPVRATVATDALVRGETYTVVSDVPSPTPQQLRLMGTSGAPPGSISLPASVPPVIGAIAGDITRDASTAYDRALAIQTFLRTFEYRQDIPPGHSGDYLVHFLTELQAGYCEQFAGSMAVMLRTLGVPARVAVGFLPGERSGGGFVVGNAQAHAWTEVWFRDAGWIPFEPTPRSGVRTPAYATSPVTRPADPASPPAPPTSPSPGATPATPSPTSSGLPGALPGPGPESGPARSPWVLSALAAGAAILLLMAARAVRLRAWGLLVRAPADRVASAWNELLLRGSDAWRTKRRAETEQEYGRAMVDGLGIDYALLEPLVTSRQRAAYSAQPPGPDDAQAAQQSLRMLRRRMLLAAAWPARLRLLLSPRPLFSGIGRPASPGATTPPPGGVSAQTPRDRAGTRRRPGRDSA